MMRVSADAVEALETVNGQIAQIAGRLRDALLVAGLSTQAAEDATLIWLECFWASDGSADTDDE